MYNKFDRVLSDGEIFELLALGNNVFTGDSEGDLYVKQSGDDLEYEAVMGLVRKIEQAVLEKLAEQEPVAWKIGLFVSASKDEVISNVRNPDLVPQPLYTHPMSCVSSMNDKAVCVSKNGESDTQSNSQGVLDSSKMSGSGDMFWIHEDYPSSDNVLEAFYPITSVVEVNIGDQYEVRRAKKLPDLKVEITEIEEWGDVKEYKVVGVDLIPDHEKMIDHKRAEFERWADRRNLSIARSFVNDDDYANHETIIAWQVWKAARGVEARKAVTPD